MYDYMQENDENCISWSSLATKDESKSSSSYDVSIATGVIVVLSGDGRKPAPLEIILKTEFHQFELYISVPSAKSDSN